MIRAVLFDADGVVQRTAPRWRDKIAGLCPKREHAERFLSDVFSAEKPCLLGEADFCEALHSVLERWQVNADIEIALRLWTMLEPMDSKCASLDLAVS